MKTKVCIRIDDDEMYSLIDLETKRELTAKLYSKSEAERIAEENNFEVVDEPRHKPYQPTIQPKYSARDIRMKSKSGIPFRGTYLK